MICAIAMKRLLIFLVMLGGAAAQAQDRIPLKDFRAKFVNQRISVNPNFTNGTYAFLGDWTFVKEKKGLYESQKNIPASYVGRTGVIIAIQAPRPGLYQPPSPQTDDTYVKYADAIVKLDTGELVATTVYTLQTGTAASDSFVLLSVREQHKKDAVALAQKLRGKSLYLTRLTKVYDMGLTTANIQTIKEGVGYSEAVIHDVPLLTPLPVVDLRYSEKLDFMLVALELPGNRKALYVPGCIEDSLTESKYGCASLAMPAFLSEEEVSAIRAGKVFVGMSEIALYMAMGFPVKTNASAAGLTQLVYHTAYVYLDKKKVAEIQKHDD